MNTPRNWDDHSEGRFEEVPQETLRPDDAVTNAMDNFVAKMSIRLTRLLPESWGVGTVYGSKEREDEILEQGLHAPTNIPKIDDPEIPEEEHLKAIEVLQARIAEFDDEGYSPEYWPYLEVLNTLKNGTNSEKLDLANGILMSNAIDANYAKSRFSK